MEDQQRCSEENVFKLRLEGREVVNSVKVGVWRYVGGRRIAFQAEGPASEGGGVGGTKRRLVWLECKE